MTGAVFQMFLSVWHKQRTVAVWHLPHFVDYGILLLTQLETAIRGAETLEGANVPTLM